MTIKITKETVVKFLICLACILSICMIFCFFGAAIQSISDYGTLKISNSVFNWIFGTSENLKSPGLIILFVVQIILMVVALVYVICVALKLTNKKVTNILAFILVVLLLIGIILISLTKIFIKDIYVPAMLPELQKYYPEATRQDLVDLLKTYYPNCGISNGPISYIVLGSISVASLVSATVLNNSNRD